MQFDVVVIGSGLSGVIAALRAISLGKKTALVRKAWGSTALSSGAFEIANDLDSYDIAQNFSKIKERNPYHPYHFLSLETLSQAVELLKKWLPIKIQGSYEMNHLFLTEQGGWKRGAFALETQFLDFKTAFHRKTLALGLPSHVKIENVVVQPWPSSSFLGGVNFLPAVTAKRLDRVDEVRKLGSHIKTKYQSSQYGLLLIPPVLGIDLFSDMKREFESLVGVLVYEMLASKNSVPGLRFQKALDAAVKKSAVTFIEGEVCGFEQERKKILAIKVKTESQKIEVQGKVFTLATGKFFSGGIFRNSFSFKETVFDLPLFYQDKKINDQSTRYLLKERYINSQPVFQCGVKTNSNLIPLDEFDEPVYENLRACGTVLRGFDPYRDGTRFGVQVLSGYKAVE